MGLVLKNKNKFVDIPARDMPENCIGIITGQIFKEYIGQCVIKRNNYILSLSNSDDTWTDASDLPDSFRVRLLSKGEELIVE